MTTPNCPKCGSGRVVDDRINPAFLDRLAQGANLARATGHPLIAAGGFGAWAMSRLLNAVCPHWRCDHCDHRFS